jgi:hypothetical protein
MSDTNSRRAALEAAFDAAEEEETPELEEESEVPSDDTEQESVEESGTPDEGESGTKDAPASGKPSKDPQKVEQEAANRQTAKKPAEKASATVPAGADSTVSAVKPPQSWTPAEREHWNKIPVAAQAAIQRRELETSRVLNESAQSRRFQGEFVDVVKPFAHLIRARNSTPLNAVKNLMETAAGLTTGNPQQKALIVAEILENYGVDIQVLDDVLSKRPANPNSGVAAIPPQLESALRPINEFMGRVEQGRQQYIQQLQANAQTAVDKAQELPFFEDLRNDIADLMEIAAARGQELTIEQAHERAVNFNPEVKKILDQRKRAAAINKDPAKIARSKKAAASINGSPRGGVGGDGKPKSRKEALLEAWDDQT